MKQTLIWLGALILGALLGLADIPLREPAVNFVASVFTRLFQLLAVPTIVLAIITTLSSIGNEQRSGRIFRHTISYTLLTTFAASAGCTEIPMSSHLLAPFFVTPRGVSTRKTSIREKIYAGRAVTLQKW